MRITTWAEYGLICALHLARRVDDGPVSGREIAAQEKLPADYVEQILLRLRRADIVQSTRGARGGYTLARPPAQWMDGGGRQGRHSEHLGYLVAEMQFLQRAYPGARW